MGILTSIGEGLGTVGLLIWWMTDYWKIAVSIIIIAGLLIIWDVLNN